MNTLYHNLKSTLTQGGIEEGEAKAIALLLLEKVCGMSMTEALTDSAKGEPHRTQLSVMAGRIAQGEPVQYVLGEADFDGMRLKVSPSVLIPRPETEELVAWVAEELTPNSQLSTLNCQLSTVNCQLSTVNCQLLDIGTGSGCIAIALAKRLPHATVEAWDISPEALAIAQENAASQGLQVTFRQVDVLGELEKLYKLGQAPNPARFDLIVSNPPYICEEEAGEMERHVLEHEPHTALFVPNHDPLLFYRHIGRLGLRLLTSGGRLFFEVNRRFGQQVVDMLEREGYHHVELRRDFRGNDRMVKAIKP